MGFDGTLSDTGWKTPVLDSGVQAVSGAPLRYRLHMGRIFWKGKVEKSTGSWATGSVIDLITGTPLLSRFCPPERRDVVAAGSSADSACKLLFHPDGTVQLVTGSASPAYVSFDVAPYWND